MHFVIIGGDAAGMSAASRAKRVDPDMNVTVFEKTGDVSYSACGMPYNIADPDRVIDDLVVRQASVFREKQGINLLTGHCVDIIDAQSSKVVGTADGHGHFEKPYDYLLIATGASPLLPDKPGFDLPGIMPLKSLADGRKIKAYIKANAVKKAVIIGMGFIGLEMVEAFCARNIQVDLLKPRPAFLPWMPEDLSQAVRAEIERHHVNLYCGHEIERIERKSDQLRVVCTDLNLDADLVLVAMGIEPCSKLAADAGIELSTGNSISVDNRLRTSHENIYAAGDCADAFHIVTGRKTWIPLALRANRAGWAVADNVCGKSTELDGIAGTAVFKVLGMQVARTGLNPEEARNVDFDPVDIVIKSRSRAHAHPDTETIWVHMVGDKKTGRLLGVQMVGREGAAHRINAPAVALHAHMTVEQFFQSDLAYAPPFGPTWDPLLTAANQLLKKM